MQQGGAAPRALDAALARRGFLNRWLSGLYRLIRRPRQMYWLGLLFGLGFDTATEIALLTTAGVAASQALPFTAVLCLPIVFAAGMSLFDSADGVLMCGAYGWALDHPIRKIFYNLTITGLSVAVALLVGTIELLSMAAGRFSTLRGGVWDAVRGWDAQSMGYVVAALFIASWVVSLGVWRLGRFDRT
jgi:nickel/cobalt transporter (NiCoT) family protein